MCSFIGKKFLEVCLGPGHIVLDVDPASPAPPKGAQEPPLFGPCLLWRNSRQSQQLLSSCSFWIPYAQHIPNSISWETYAMLESNFWNQPKFLFIISYQSYQYARKLMFSVRFTASSELCTSVIRCCWLGYSITYCGRPM